MQPNRQGEEEHAKEEDEDEYEDEDEDEHACCVPCVFWFEALKHHDRLID